MKRGWEVEAVRGPEERFPTTHWSQIYEAQTPQRERGRQALGRLLERYSEPLLAHLRAHYELSVEEAEDLLQEFIEKRVLEQHLLSKARQGRGRFRSFLLSSLDYFVFAKWRYKTRGVRYPEGGLVSMAHQNVYEQVVQQAAKASPFDVEWARTVLEQAARRTAEFYRHNGDERPWKVFYDGVIGPLQESLRRPSYAELARRHGLRSAEHTNNTLRMVKRQFGKELRRVIAQYVKDETEVEDELRELIRILAEPR